MVESSMIPCKGCTPWQGLLFTVSLLTCWYRPTTAHVTIESVPAHVVEGESNLFLVHNLPDNLLTISWFKEEADIDHKIATYTLKYNIAVPGAAHSGRETVYPNGSLWIQNVTHKDTGFYILETRSRKVKFISTIYIHLHVYTSVLNCGRHLTSAQPTIESVPPRVTKGSSVLLVVHNLPENLRALSWYKGINVFKNHEVGRHIIAKNSSVPGPAHSGRETVYSNGSLVLHNVTWKDAGFYTLLTLTTDLAAEVAHVQLQLDTSHCGYHPTSAQLTLESVPPNIAKGRSVLLVVHHLPENLRGIFWYKGDRVSQSREIAKHIIATNSSVPGPAHSGRETLYSNGSLLLHSPTYKDAGWYTLLTVTTDMKPEIVHIHLQLDTSLSACCKDVTSAQLTIEQVPRDAAKGESVLFLVHNLPEDLQTFSWYKSIYSTHVLQIAEYSSVTNSITQGHAHSSRTIMYSNGSLLLQNVTEKDAGFYTLQTLNRVFKTEKIHVELHVNPCRLPPAQLTIESMPRNVVEGENALLLVYNIPENLRSFVWYKGIPIVKSTKIAQNVVTSNKTMLGPAHSGRETMYPNGSLLFQYAAQKDTGFYTLRTLNAQFETQEAHVYLHIYKPVTQPFIRVTSTKVTVRSSVVFTCLSADTGISTQWIFNNQNLQLTDRMTLSPKKCRLSIDPVRMEDAGEYKCEVSNPVSSMTSLPVRLAVMNE
ncbi:carcinoembryonic antigen-related cell adhesion molecule 3-like [Peromyscus californicus insignis]|uniref:carcinoembryonic antigen-related cell adhesion molecule 3-like n=1 Tax=Peromyscus californicus insignis TaxID=564181 RepID=UPI0022A74202|nr:carcinoembryonic antigen-related cell adhesion molecule 3-like [Peromyscus californicus insignis]